MEQTGTMSEEKPNVSSYVADEALENPFMRVVNKRLRNAKKKMQKIEALEAKNPSEINPEQEALLHNKPNIKLLLDELSAIYHAMELEAAPPPEVKPPKSKKAGKDKPPQAEPTPATATDDKMEQGCQTDPLPEPEPAAIPEAPVVEVPKEPVKPAPEPVPVNVVEMVAKNSGMMSSMPPNRMDIQCILGLFKAFAVVSHTYLHMRLCHCLDYERQPPMTPAELNELAHLAQLVLEMPISNNTSILMHQDKSGSEHLALFLAESPLHPAILGPDGETFTPMAHSYAQLRKVLDEVCRAMRTDKLLQTHIIAAMKDRNQNQTMNQVPPEVNTGYASAQHVQQAQMPLVQSLPSMPPSMPPQSQTSHYVQNQASHHDRLPDRVMGERPMNGMGDGGDGSMGGPRSQRGQGQNRPRRPPQQGHGKMEGGGEGGVGGGRGGYVSQQGHGKMEGGGDGGGGRGGYAGGRGGGQMKPRPTHQ